VAADGTVGRGFERQCRGCGQTFVTSDVRQWRCRRRCQGRRRGEPEAWGPGTPVAPSLRRSTALLATFTEGGSTSLARIPDAALTRESLAAAVGSGRATPAAVAQAVSRMRRVDLEPRPEPPGPVPSPRYASWEDWLGRVSPAEVRHWCQLMAHSANRPRLLSGRPQVRVHPETIWAVIAAARGRCAYCGSLAVERRPSGPHGQPIAWAAVGRRIGSLAHRTARFHGGGNEAENLAWSCLWCNTWLSERRPGALDHGGFHPSVKLEE
jgi:hypothetical protein